MEQSKQSKVSLTIELINDKKSVDKAGSGAALSTEHYKIMIMQNLDAVSTYKKLDLNIYMKIRRKFEKAFTQTQ